MSNMFTNYDNISENYIPNNMNNHVTKPCSYTKLDPYESSKPYELYNAKGELEGYFWYYGEQTSLSFSIDGEIILDDGTLSGQFVDAKDYLIGKTAAFKLYNFRLEPIYTVNQPASTEIEIKFDSELAKKLVKGIYYCSLDIISEDTCENVFATSDCKLLIK